MHQLPFGRYLCDQEDVSGCAWVYVGGRTSDLNSSSRFLSDILGFRRVHDGKGLVQLELPSGQLFEVSGSESRYYQFHNCPVVGFQVEDVRAAKQEMESKGTSS